MNAQTITPPVPTSEQIIHESKVILKGVTWQTFQALLADVGDDRAWRIAYDSGVLEIRMPYQEHEVPTGMLESFVEALADELEIEVMKLRSLLLKREDLARAIEPDTCFYIQNEALVRSRNIDLQTDPPPDLAVESDYTNSSLNKFTIYASLGVPELWRYRRQTLEVYQLVEGQYEPVTQSLAFPFLPIAEIPGFIEQSREIGQRSAVRLFRTSIREILKNSESID
ncbi:MAG: Uma2 family endonuclease [Microcoleus sp. CSU_2_2]|nr:Uma2 family endonuclease [Microcoleus sp. SU_5_3]NJS11516.1 Uma2 family endonuclease [Microcoleus sp. CSU_2_2]